MPTPLTACDRKAAEFAGLVGCYSRPEAGIVTGWRAALLGIVIATASAAGCAAPTLPIPPPTALVTPPDAMGYVTVSGQADVSAFVFVLNENSESGLIGHATALGTYSIRIQAAVGDEITVWQEIGNRPSQQANVPVP
jgi:hypothetical protein